ncbi:MAG: CocE/NonD family hydrolase [Actinomycetota bacterium]
MSPRPRFVPLIVALALLAAACGGDGDQAAQPDEPTSTPAPTVATEPTETAEADADEPAEEPAVETEPQVDPESVPFTLRPSVNQLHILDAAPASAVSIEGPGGFTAEGVVDELGSLLFRDVPAGEFTVRAGEAATTTTVADVTDPAPDASFYADQEIGEGFGYLTTRDGTTLSVNVTLPAGDGPYPTVVEYSGYDPSNPGSGTFAQLYTTLGYAYVGVNMRGTGCSGGSFEFFEPVQLLDGYDAIEAVAAQPWVFDNEVGMVGVSYPGISQLFVASTQPPSLAAITPLSVLDDSARSTLYPGGILNTGFAADWSAERESDSAPYGQGWEQGVVDAGDTVCEANQLVRLQNTDAASLILDNPYYDPAVADAINPSLLVDRIEVPVFLAGAWQDEQTGGHFPAMLDDFTATPALYATIMNGSHTESIANVAVLERFIEFLDLYVAKRTPDLAAATVLAPIIGGGLTGAAVGLPTGDRFSGLSYEEALAAYEQDPRIRILFESGYGDPENPGAPVPRYEAGYESWPPPEGQLVTWYLRGDGRMTTEPEPTAAGDDESNPPSSYVADPDNVASTIYEGDSGGIWRTEVDYDWQPIPAGSGVDWITEPLTEDLVAVGFGSLDLWLRSSADDTDLEVTISEVRADGSEIYVQTGWLRASRRTLDESESRPNRPVHTHLESDAAPLPDPTLREFTEVRVEIFPFAHAFRAGSQVRVTVDAPGGARPLWAFDTALPGGEVNEIAHDADFPSKLVLRSVPGIDVPAEAPPCGALRSQPCREYVSLRN